MAITLSGITISGGMSFSTGPAPDPGLVVPVPVLTIATLTENSPNLANNSLTVPTVDSVITSVTENSPNLASLSLTVPTVDVAVSTVVTNLAVYVDLSLTVPVVTSAINTDNIDVPVTSTSTLLIDSAVPSIAVSVELI